MAELLVRTVNNTHTDPVKDKACYKKGDIVLAAPDGYVWSRMESKKQWVNEGLDPNLWPGGFAILKVADITIEQAQVYLQESNISDFIRRKSNLKWADIKAALPTNKLAIYQEFAELTVTRAALVSFLENKI